MPSARTLSFFLTPCLLLGALTACKKTEPTPTQVLPDPTIYEGAVFRDGFSAQVFPDRVEAPKSAQELDPNCSGFLTEEPVLIANFVGDIPARIHVTADVDTILLIQKEDGPTQCSDDFDEMHPSLHQKWTEGKYYIYVGTAERLESDFDYELNFFHYDPRFPLEGRPWNKPAPQAPSEVEKELPVEEENDLP